MFSLKIDTQEDMIPDKLAIKRLFDRADLKMLWTGVETVEHFFNSCAKEDISRSQAKIVDSLYKLVYGKSKTQVFNISYTKFIQIMQIIQEAQHGLTIIEHRGLGENYNTSKESRIYLLVGKV